MFDNENMADLFEEEKSKKKSRDEKKLEKIRAKQQKLEAKKEENDKILERDSEVKFTKLDNNKENKIANKINLVEDKKLSSKKLNNGAKAKNKVSVIEFLYDTLFGFITILLFFTSVGYLGYIYYKDNTINNVIVGILLVVIGLFYMLSMFTKNNRLRKIFAIVTSLALMSFMAFELFVI